MNKIPPHAIEIEDGILGICLLDSKLTDVVFESLSGDHFYKPANRQIFDVIKFLWRNNKQVDLLTVENVLNERGQLEGIGGTDYLSDLTCFSGTSGSIENYCQILTEKALLRKIIEQCQFIIDQSYNKEADVYNVIDELNRIAEHIDGGSKSIHSLTPEQIFDREKNLPIAEKLRTGSTKMDNGIYKDTGLCRGQVELTIADSGHGKTQYALYKTALLLRQGYKVLWFQMEDYDVNTAKHFAINCPDYIDNIYICHDLYEIEAIKREARTLNREQGIDYIVFDYVQNIEALKQNRSDQVEYISQQITRLAKDLNVVCHVLSQVTLNYSKREGWKQEPMYGDVRWSQQLKQDAHIITSVFRPSRIDKLVVERTDGHMIKDWTDSLQPYNSVYVKQAKTRYGKQVYTRLHLIHNDQGLKLYENEIANAF